MKNLRIARAQLNGSHVTRTLDWNPDDEVTKHIAALVAPRGKYIGLGQRQFQIRRPQFPASCKTRRGRQTARVTLLCTLRRPFPNSANLLIRKSLFIGKAI